MENIFFDENGNEIHIKPTYLTMPQLEKELGVAYSTIRYWCKEFEEFLDIDLERRKKEFNQRDVELIKLIKAMTRGENGYEKMTIKQAKEYFKENIDKFDAGIKIDTESVSDLAINNIIDERLNTKLDEFKKDLVGEISTVVVNKVEELFKINYIATEKKLEDIKSEISVTICDEVDSKTSGIKEELKKEIEISTNKISDNISNEMRAILDDIESINQEIKESNDDVALKVKEMLEHRKQEQMELERRIAEENKSKSFLSRLFGR